MELTDQEVLCLINLFHHKAERLDNGISSSVESLIVKNFLKIKKVKITLQPDQIKSRSYIVDCAVLTESGKTVAATLIRQSGSII